MFAIGMLTMFVIWQVVDLLVIVKYRHRLVAGLAELDRRLAR
jgi:hypothetical protein